MFPATDLAPAEILARVRQERILILRDHDPGDLLTWCRRLGPILAWPFGEVLEVKVHDDPQNYLFTPGDVPFHWDGAFAAAVPELQVFHCIQAPPPGSGGETTFVDAVALARELDLDGLTATYETERVAHYGGKVTWPLIGRHPRTAERVLRFAEPAGDATAPLNTPTVTIDGLSPAAARALMDDLTRRLRAHTFTHAWRSGDVLIADNHALLHGRRPFAAHAPRHLRRVHVLEGCPHA